jgi:hypothetical protein
MKLTLRTSPAKSLRVSTGRCSSAVREGAVGGRAGKNTWSPTHNSKICAEEVPVQKRYIGGPSGPIEHTLFSSFMA